MDFDLTGGQTTIRKAVVELAARSLMALPGTRCSPRSASSQSFVWNSWPERLPWTGIQPRSRWVAAFVRVGFSAGEVGTSWQLTRLFGPGRAAEIAYIGRVVPAEAELIGLVNRVVPADQLLDEAVGIAKLVVRNSPGGVRMAKRALQRIKISRPMGISGIGEPAGTPAPGGEGMPEALMAFSGTSRSTVHRKVVSRDDIGRPRFRFRSEGRLAALARRGREDAGQSVLGADLA